MKIKYLVLTGLILFFLGPLNLYAAQLQEYPINQESDIEITMIDVNGTAIALGMGVENVSFSYYFREKSEGKFFAYEGTSITADLSEKGRTSITVSADTPGVYEVLFAFDIEYNYGDIPRKILTKELDIEFTKVKTKKFLGYQIISPLDRLTTFSAYSEDDMVYVPFFNTLHLLGINFSYSEDNLTVIDVEYNSDNYLEEIAAVFNPDVSQYYVALDTLLKIADIQVEKLKGINDEIQVLKFFTYTE